MMIMTMMMMLLKLLEPMMKTKTMTIMTVLMC